MPFIPHTADDVADMLAVIGAGSLDDLFDEIPATIRAPALTGIPDGRPEMDVLAEFAARARLDDGVVCFAGAGCYDHHVPAAIWDVASRGEFMTAYTPYQAEASQGTLQLIYEFQSMMAELTALDVSNASVYDGGSGLGEAVLMAVRANRGSKSRRVLVAGTLSPLYRSATEAIVGNQDITLQTLPEGADGTLDLAALEEYADQDFAALVIAQPNFFGRLEEVDTLVDWAHANGQLVIGVVNPLALAVLEPPGAWGANGADIACGDGQPFGIPMSSGGPSFGFLCAREKIVRQMPGRIIGLTRDLEGRRGFTLTLQAREQHIRRGKATSNICTNQGLLVTAGTLYMALLGHAGLVDVARACMANTDRLIARLCEIPGVRRAHAGPVFHEAVLALPCTARHAVDRLAELRILAGVALDAVTGDPDRAHELLVCATEKRTAREIEAFAEALAE